MRTANDVLHALTPDQLVRFWTKVDRSDGCWEWRGAIHPNGYGTWTVRRSGGRSTSVRPHRVAWFAIRGPIPDGLVLDHQCRNQTCVNPDHLEIVSHGMNLSRMPLTGESMDATVTALLATCTPDEVVAWWSEWLSKDARGRIVMQRTLRAMGEGLFEAEAS